MCQHPWSKKWRKGPISGMANLLDKPVRRGPISRRCQSPSKHDSRGDTAKHIFKRQSSDGIKVPSCLCEDTGGHTGCLCISNHKRSIPTSNARCYCPWYHQGVDVFITGIKIHHIWSLVPQLHEGDWRPEPALRGNNMGTNVSGNSHVGTWTHGRQI